MIKACKSARVAALSENDLGRAMSAGVEKRANFTSDVPTHDDRLLTHRSGDVVARTRNLALVADEIPHTKKNFIAFDLEDARVCVDSIVHEIFLRQQRFYSSDSHSFDPVLNKN